MKFEVILSLLENRSNVQTCQEHLSRLHLEPGLMLALVPVPMARDARGVRPSLVPVRKGPLVPVVDLGLMLALVPVPTARDARGVRPPIVPVRKGPLVPVGLSNWD
jgi:hypothetical protein